MSSVFRPILEEFQAEMDSLSQLLDVVKTQAASAKARVAFSNGATLLLAATFEEFVRQVAREFAKIVVSKARRREDLPKDLLSAVWRRSLDGLGRQRIADLKSPVELDSFLTDAMSRFSAAHRFCEGDFSQDIFKDLIHNENNMRPAELNSLFRIIGLTDVCTRAATKGGLKDYFGEADDGKIHGSLVSSLNDFIRRRNEISHSLNPSSSSSPEQLIRDVDLLKAISLDLVSVLEE